MEVNNLPILKLSSESMSAEEQYLSWRTCVAPFFYTEPICDAEQFNSESTWHLLDDLVITESHTSHSSYQRDKKWLSQHDDAEHMLFQLYLQGTNRGVNGEQFFISDVGDITAVDTRKEIYTQTNKCKILSVVVPRHLVHDADSLNGATLTAGTVRARLLKENILTLWKSLPEIKPEESSVFSRSLIDLTSALFKFGGDLQQNEVVALDNSIRASMNTYIEENLYLPRLGVALLCRTFNCSRTTLYRLFQKESGVAIYIRQRRLVAAFKILIKPSNANVRIIDVAMNCGFTNQASFSRLFRQSFGVSPRDLISLQTIDAFNEQPSNLLTAHKIAQWVKAL